jgi:pyruvate/2-oxoglutarate/acetoin dehydrogenase E1 component
MEADPRVFLMGEDIGAFGGAFGVTRGLLERFGPRRVLDTPISEAALTGVALGAALTGGRPVLEIMYETFLTLSLDQLVNHAAKVRYMTGGQVSVPMVIRTAGGIGGLDGAQHCQGIEAWLMHVPGIRVICPATPSDAKGLLKAAIRDDNPVVFLEHKLLYFEKGNVADTDEPLVLGQAAVRRRGKDLTLIAYARMCQVALEAADELARHGYQAEVIDLRCLAPLDTHTILESIKKTNRALIVEEDCQTSGVGAEIIAQINEGAFDYLDAPVGRLAALDVPVPAAQNLEPLVYPAVQDVVHRAQQMLQ